MKTKLLKRTLPAVAMAGGLIMATTGCNQQVFDSYAIPAIQANGNLNCPAGTLTYGPANADGFPTWVGGNQCRDFTQGRWNLGCNLTNSYNKAGKYQCNADGAVSGRISFDALIGIG